MRDRVLFARLFFDDFVTTELQGNFTEIALRHGCSPINLLHIFGTPFLKNTFELLLLIETQHSTTFLWVTTKSFYKQSTCLLNKK